MLIINVYIFKLETKFINIIYSPSICHKSIVRQLTSTLKQVVTFIDESCRL
jgi:hypothetical protein